MKPMTFWEMLTPIMAPTAIAIAELISRFRRSTRCSKNDILPPASCSGGVSDGSDGEVVIRRFLLSWSRGVRRNRRRGGVRTERLLDCGGGLYLESGNAGLILLVLRERIQQGLSPQGWVEAGRKPWRPPPHECAFVARARALLLPGRSESRRSSCGIPPLPCPACEPVPAASAGRK